MGLTKMNARSKSKLNAYLKGAKAALVYNRKKINPYTHRSLIEQWDMGYQDQREGLLTEEFNNEK
jgi:hypothetical protein